MPYAISPEERVNTYTSSRQSGPQTLALPDGGYLTVWSGAGEPDQGYGVYLQRYDAEGGKVGGEVLVNTTTVYSQRHPEVTLLASGGYAVTWDSTVPGGGPGDADALGIFVQTFDPAGVPIGSETRVSDAGHSQRITALADGGYVVVWTHAADYPWSGVSVRRFDAAGEAVGEAWVLDDDVDATLASVTASDAGFLAVWRAYDDDGPAIAIQAFGADGARLGDEVRIPRDNDQTAPEVVSLIDGGFALVWRESDGLYAQILTGDGQPSGERFLVQTAPPGVGLLHSVVATPDGGFTVAWDRFEGGGSVSVEARAFFADGSPNGETINIRKPSGAPGEPPGLATLASGEVVLTYSRYVGDVVEYFDVFQVRLTPLTPTTRGTDADDHLTGRSGADRLMGLQGADFLLGLEGDDTLVGGVGDDVLDGGAGRDEAVFAGVAAGYTIVEESGGYRVKGADGADWLTGIELLRFDDQVIDLTMIVCHPPADSVAGKGEAPPLVLPDPGLPGDALHRIAATDVFSGTGPDALRPTLEDFRADPTAWLEWG